MDRWPRPVCTVPPARILHFNHWLLVWDIVFLSYRRPAALANDQSRSIQMIALCLTYMKWNFTLRRDIWGSVVWMLLLYLFMLATENLQLALKTKQAKVVLNAFASFCIQIVRRLYISVKFWTNFAVCVCAPKHLVADNRFIMLCCMLIGRQVAEIKMMKMKRRTVDLKAPPNRCCLTALCSCLDLLIRKYRKHLIFIVTTCNYVHWLVLSSWNGICSVLECWSYLQMKVFWSFCSYKEFDGSVTSW